ncbi:molybdenum cofactor biosynthesis protein MoaE [Candidatus Magnetaquicoccus inordinatus]|uniref:molybdenum cofactor biosynthesis protein MoaE n=1 Tax=Candidatus Magnetaquicoccus inordinatus TaxID=2496818 RepID=UPI001D0E1BC9|nr:molybdenum cofactor biosynthesis protein MoaE [Candidatus Magnetaquicoccus inordinatus]
MIRVQQEPFSLETEVNHLVQNNPKVGGVVTFLGMVRDFTSSADVTTLLLEHYPGMTESELENIEQQARQQFALEELLVIHRVGALTVGESIVLVVAAASHRADAFLACRYVIDHLKHKATFWKKEILLSGEERWVDSCPGCAAAIASWSDSLAHSSHATEVPHSKECHQQTPAPLTSPPAPRWNGLRLGILTLSDSRSLSNDQSGDTLQQLAEQWGATVVARKLLPDNQQEIQDLLLYWSDSLQLDLIMTTGGTGPSTRDVTPEATRAVCNRELPGFAEQIRAAGLQQTRNALFTRGVAAFRGTTLVLNLPGSTRGAKHSLLAVADLIPHALRMARGEGHH